MSRGFAAHGAYNGQLLPPGFDKLETEEAVTRELTKLAALPGASCLKTVYGGAMKVFEGMACRKAIGPVKGTGFGGEGMGPYKDRAYPLFADKRPASELEITRSLAPLMADPLRRACLEENYPSLGEAYDQAVDPARSPMPPPTPQPNLTPLPDAEGWIGSATPQEVEEALASAYTRKGRRWTYTIVTVADGVEESLEYVEEVLETSVELATVRSTTTKAGQRPEIKERSDPYRLVATPGEAAIVRERLEVAGGTFLTVTWTSSLPDGRVEHTWVAKGVGVVKTRREVPSTGAAITIELESFEP